MSRPERDETAHDVTIERLCERLQTMREVVLHQSSEGGDRIWSRCRGGACSAHKSGHAELGSPPNCASVVPSVQSHQPKPKAPAVARTT